MANDFTARVAGISVELGMSVQNKSGIWCKPTLFEEDIKSSGYVVDSLEASIWCLYNSNSYTEAVLRAVNLGEDTDTIGAITGSLAGLFIGGEHLPKEWVDSLQAKDKILQIVDRFYEQYK